MKPAPRQDEPSSLARIIARMADDPNLNPNYRRALRQAISVADVVENIEDGKAQDAVEHQTQEKRP